MDVLASRELTIDLGLWRHEAEVDLISPGAVTVGHVADELIRFLNLPGETTVGQRISYSLAPDREPDADNEAVELDRETLVAELDDGAVTLVSDVVSLISQATDKLTANAKTKAGELEAAIRARIDKEIDQWIGKGRALVVGALDDAMNEVRERLPADIAALIPPGRRGVLAQYRGSRAMKRFAAIQARPGYDGEVRTGMAMARRSTNLVFRVAGRMAASVGGGGVAGAGAGGVTGAAIGAGTGAGAGAVAGVIAAAAATLALTVGSGDIVEWFVFDPTATASAGSETAASNNVVTPDGKNENDLLLDLEAGAIKRWGADGWGALTWPSATGSDLGAASSGHEHIAYAVADHDHDHDSAYSATDHKHEARIDAGLKPPAETNEADFFIDQCTGVLYGNNEDNGWQPLVELSLVSGEALTQGCSPQSIRPGQTLWALVRQACGEAPNAELAREVNRTWLANLGTIGSDPNALPQGELVAVKCE